MNAFNTDFLSETNKTMISVENLMLGMYVCELDKPWKDSPFLFQGFLIQNEELLEQVRRECSFVYIDTYRTRSIFTTTSTQPSLFGNKAKPETKKRSTGQASKKAQKKPKLASSKGEFNKIKEIVDYQISAEEITPPEKIKTFEQEINIAQQVHVRTGHVIKRFLNDASKGIPINSGMATNAVYECMRSILRSPDAMMLMTHLRNKNEYTWHHSMNVCVLAIALGRHLNLRYDELITLGLCGMLHDIGKMRIPSDILDHPGVYTPEERLIMQSHTSLGYKILSENSSIAEIVAEVAHNHHERIDGQGFPRRLKSHEISPFAKMIAIVDTYDAVTTERSYKPGKTHLEAINILLDSSGTALDGTLVNHFIQCIGVYPSGSIVETHSGEIGMVIEVNQKKKLKPKMVMLLNKDKKPQRKKVIDLSHPEFDSTNHPHLIKTIIRPDKYDIDVSRFYNYGAIQKGLSAA